MLDISIQSRIMKRPEEALQRTVAQYLDLALPKDAVWFHVPNGGARSKAEAGVLKAMGVKAGVPDIYILCNGTSLFIELKPPKRYLTMVQKEMRERIQDAGGACHMCRSLEEVQDILHIAGFVHWSNSGPTVKVRAG